MDYYHPNIVKFITRCASDLDDAIALHLPREIINRRAKHLVQFAGFYRENRDEANKLEEELDKAEYDAIEFVWPKA